MKKSIPSKAIIAILINLLAANTTFAQFKFEHAGVYVDSISNYQKEIAEQSMRYASSIAHENSTAKVENARKVLIQTVKLAQEKIKQFPPYQDDASLRDSTITYLRLAYMVLNEDYSKILDLEEVAEQSYDLMEAYFLAQELAEEKLNEANDRFEETFYLFAKNHSITILPNEGDELSDKLKTAAEVTEYYHQVYLIFFKSYKQELCLLDAIEQTNINAIEQNKNQLVRDTKDGIKKMEDYIEFKGDNSLHSKCTALLEFYNKEAEKSVSITIKHVQIQAEYEEQRALLDRIKKSKRTQKMIDQYNQSVQLYNESVKRTNKSTIDLNETRGKLIDDWNNTTSKFLKRHIPKYE